MKKCLLLALLMFALTHINAQNPINKREVFQQTLTEASNLLDQGQFSEALSKSEEALAQAEGLYDFRYQALAQFIRGKAYYGMGGKKRNDAANAFEKSLQFASMKNLADLQKQNLELLIAIAQEKGREKEALRYEKQLHALLKPETTTLPSAPVLAEAPSLPKSGLKEENQKLNEQLVKLSSELSAKQTSQQQLAMMGKERTKLFDIINTQQQAITAMSEREAKYALSLLQQKKMVDSLSYLKTLDSMTLATHTSELKEKESELALQKSERNLMMLAMCLVILIGIGLGNRYLNMRKNNQILAEKNKIIQAERERSESLLLNILPAAIADELKNQGVAKSKQYREATVLFADFQNFTHAAEVLGPEQLIAELDFCFKAFDRIVGQYDLEKIKTIGDAYMCVGGVPDDSKASADQVVKAALAMQAFLEDYKKERKLQGRYFFEARVGVHTGSVIAGVVGEKKFAFDIWGDTVNVAARIESNGQPGKVNISGSTFDLVKSQFNCTPRGKIAAKNKGEVEMYWVESSLN
jgi:adenylate cyclase